MKKAWNCAESPAKWIFPEREKDCINQYVDFFHEFSSTGKSAELRISADTDFVVWLNGQLVGHGQYSDYPDAKTFESFTLNDLKKDGNQLAITVFYNGRNSSVYRRQWR